MGWWLWCKIVSSGFFFQAEDGIRDYKVTGVQTCALPICLCLSLSVCLCLSVCLSVCLCLSLSASLCLCLSVSVCVCFCFALFCFVLLCCCCYTLLYCCFPLLCSAFLGFVAGLLAFTLLRSCSGSILNRFWVPKSIKNQSKSLKINQN